MPERSQGGKVADIWADLDVEDKKYVTKLDRAEKKAGSLTKTIGKIAGAVGGALAVRFGIQAIHEASMAEEAMNKFRVVFRDSAAEVERWASVMENRFGGTRRETIQMLSGFQDLLVPMGLARKDAAELSKLLFSLSGDLASFNDRTVADVSNLIKSFILGEHQAGKSLGIMVNQHMLLAKAAEMTGKTTIQQLTEQEKALARVQLALEQSSDAIGDYARTADSIANLSKRFKSARGDAKEALGQILTQLFDVRGALQSAVGGTESLEERMRALVDSGKLIQWSEALKAAGKKLWLFFKTPIALTAAAFTAFFQDRGREIKWLIDNWRELGRNLWETMRAAGINIGRFFKITFMNILDNAVELGANIWSAIRGRGFDAEFRDVMDGFEKVEPARVEVQPLGASTFMDVMKATLADLAAEEDRIDEQMAANIQRRMQEKIDASNKETDNFVSNEKKKGKAVNIGGDAASLVKVAQDFALKSAGGMERKQEKTNKILDKIHTTLKQTREANLAPPIVGS